MKKFIFITYGGTKRKPEQRTEEIMKPWKEWFGSIGDKLIDGPNPLTDGDHFHGQEASKKGVKKIEADMWPATGYMTIHATDLDEAIEIAKASPMVMNDEKDAAIRVYEVMSK